MPARLRAALGLVLLGLPLLSAAPARADTTSPPPVKHVWTIMLENSDLATTAAQDAVQGSAYLSRTLASRGAFVPNYFGTGHSSLDNYLAMLAGQGPTEDTKGDCSNDVVVGGDQLHSTFDADGQALGRPADVAAGHAGCVYAADVPTLVDQLKAKGLTWRGYMEDIDGSPASLRTTCQAARWAGQLNAAPGTPTLAHNDYKRKHDPFEYFHSITGTQPASGTSADTPGHAPSPDCDANVVPLRHLFDDLRSEDTTPAFSYITPNQCHDGHDNPCSDGTTGGVAEIDSYLPSLVDPILASPAYADGGLLVITFDEGVEGFACCGEKTSFNLAPGDDNGGEAGVGTEPVPATRGGGQVGAVMLSPFIAPGTVSASCYNHYSWLRSMEDLFRIGPTAAIPGSDHAGHIGYAGALGDGVVPTMVNGSVVPCASPAAFGSDIFISASDPTPVVPEAPVAVLLPLLAGGALAFLARGRRRSHRSG